MRTIVILTLLGCIAICLTCKVSGSEPASAEPAAAPASDAPGAPLRYDSERTGESAHNGTTQALIASLTIFVLAVFVGFEVITKVPPTLHTPLMSGSNAISGITLVGALVSAGAEQTGLATWLGTIAVAMATINVVGGFLVTHRMLEMFRKK
jgi:NAD(P) transhydrogenase subunit alpha